MRFYYDENRHTIVASTPAGDYPLSDGQGHEALDSLESALRERREHARRIGEKCRQLTEFEK